MEEKNGNRILLSIKDLVVKFHVRGRTLTAIRGISLDILENESIAIVGESGSGKSVFTKTFAGMLDSNGFIDQGKIIFDDEELADTKAALNRMGRWLIRFCNRSLDRSARLEAGAETWQKILDLDAELRRAEQLSEEESHELSETIADLRFHMTETFNRRQTLDSRKEKEQIKACTAEINAYKAQIKALEKKRDDVLKAHKKEVLGNRERIAAYRSRRDALIKEWKHAVLAPVPEETRNRNGVLAKEIYLSVGRYGFFKRMQLTRGLLRVMKQSMRMGVDLDNEEIRNNVFDQVAFRVRYLDETPEHLHGTCILNLANIKYAKDWMQIRGRRIATVFQDPMTSLNPIITIGKQITSIIIKHQNCSEAEARQRALILMKKVGIPNAEKRFDDYPFQYSGGMRQRIVIAIALSCQPKILICDEPTTALDVTIQAQILKLLKDLQKEFGYTIVFITHDLGVVANIADRVAVLYAGQIVELGKVEEVFYDPRHPYTWALLSSLPQLAERNTKLYSISGTPPSLYNQITGDPFAPRNPYCLKIDTLKEPPMFRVTDTHYAKTWLLDPRAPKTEKPEMIRDIHTRLMQAFNI